MNRLVLAVTVAAIIGNGGDLLARAPDHVVLLWPNGAPGAKGDKPVDKPDLSVYLPDRAKATGAGVVICPGGGYGFLAVDHEGAQVADWLNSLGVAALVL